MASPLPGPRLPLALALISAAVIAYQLALMQILSLIQWHHFASLIIAVALLGFGAAGTCLSLMRLRLMRNFSRLLPLLLALSGAAMALVPGIAQGPGARFDSLLVFTGASQVLRLLITCGLYLLPFFLAGLAIGMIFVHGAERIGTLYFWNLAGSGAGGAAMTGLLWFFPPPALPGIVSLAAVAAGLVVLPGGLRGTAPPPGERNVTSNDPAHGPYDHSGAPRHDRPPDMSAGMRRIADENTATRPGEKASAPAPTRPGKDSAGSPGEIPEARAGGHWREGIIAAILLCFLAAAFSLIRPPVPVLSEFKDLRRALLLPGARITHEQSSPYGLVQALSADALRYAPGLSLAWQGRLPVSRAVFNNGDWYGAIVPLGKGPEDFLDYTTGALPYALATRRTVLILDAGTGSLVPQALGRGAERVAAVEPHPAVLSLLTKELAGETGNLLAHPSLSVSNLSSRTFLFLDSSRYDLILFPAGDAFGGASGLYAIRERDLLTVEAFRQMWRKLTPAGAMSVTAWMDYPVRHPLKLLATFAAALEAEGVRDVRAHLAAVRGWGTITFLAKKSPLDAADAEKIRRFCGSRLFDPALLPGLGEEERARHNGIRDEGFFDYLEAILSPARERFYDGYAFNIRPAGDDRPYFSQFIRWRSLPELAGLYGARTVPFLEVGYLLVLLTLVLVVVIAAALILLPLGALTREGGFGLATLLYFGGLGIGYMFVEIVLIQRFLLYVGNPIHAAAVVISGMLVFSGIGSLLSARWIRTQRRALALFTWIVLVLGAYAFLLTPLLQTAIALPPAIKIVLSLLLIAPAALAMGMPFPLGIRLLTRTAAHEIPWAWGINGCLSVVGTLLAAVIAVELGFALVMILAALAYGVTLIGGIAGLFRREAFRG